MVVYGARQLEKLLPLQTPNLFVFGCFLLKLYNMADQDDDDRQQAINLRQRLLLHLLGRDAEDADTNENLVKNLKDRYLDDPMVEQGMQPLGST